MYFCKFSDAKLGHFSNHFIEFGAPTSIPACYWKDPYNSIVFDIDFDSALAIPSPFPCVAQPLLRLVHIRDRKIGALKCVKLIASCLESVSTVSL